MNIPESTLEAVAKAIGPHDRGFVEWDYASAELRDKRLKMARAAIDAYNEAMGMEVEHSTLGLIDSESTLQNTEIKPHYRLISRWLPTEEKDVTLEVERERELARDLVDKHGDRIEKLEYALSRIATGHSVDMAGEYTKHNEPLSGYEAREIARKALG